MKPVMYHYVRPDAPGLPHFPFLHVRDFEQQLDHFERTVGVVDREAFARWTEGGAPPQGVLLTFDDGLRDHVEYVLPILQARRYFGLFYLPSVPLLQGDILDVHKLHLVIGRLGGAATFEWIRTNHPSLAQIAQGAGPYGAQRGSVATGTVKYLFNWLLSPDERRRPLDELMHYAFEGERFEWQELYMDETDVRRLVHAGMGVGAHGHAHLLLNRLSDAEQDAEISRSCELVQSIVGTLRWGYCYAYGRETSFNAESKRIVRGAGCPFAFAVKPADIDVPFTEASPYSLPRHNCNRFPHGAASAEHAAAIKVGT